MDRYFRQDTATCVDWPLTVTDYSHGLQSRITVTDHSHGNMRHGNMRGLAPYIDHALGLQLRSELGLGLGLGFGLGFGFRLVSGLWFGFRFGTFTFDRKAHDGRAGKSIDGNTWT